MVTTFTHPIIHFDRRLHIDCAQWLAPVAAASTIISSVFALYVLAQGFFVTF